jgi:hypothetical protein
VNIVAEYLSVMRRMPLAAAQELHGRFGIPWRAIATTVPAPMMVTFADKGRLYEPAAAHGFPVWVSPVAVVDPARPEEIEATDPLDVVQCGPFVDLVAFDPCRPRRFARRTGLALVLGCIRPQYCESDPVPVRRDVADWLRAECDGLVVLTHDPHEAGRLLRRIAAIEAEDPEHLAALRACVMLPPYPPPPPPIFSVRRAA